VKVCDTNEILPGERCGPSIFPANYAGLKYSYMHKEIAALQEQLETAFLANLEIVERKALDLHRTDPAKAREFLTDFGERTTAETLAKWWDLAEGLIVKYNDGLLREGGRIGQPLGYPRDGWRPPRGFGSPTYEKPTGK
jgi:hypothetical protein